MNSKSSENGLNKIGPDQFYWRENGSRGQGDALTINANRRHFLLQNERFVSSAIHFVIEKRSPIKTDNGRILRVEAVSTFFYC